MPRIKIGQRWVGGNEPVYFIADIGANHDGNLERALKLIRLAAEAGADAVKFQHFRADKIVSKRGFEELGRIGHQATWSRSVYETYKAAEVPWQWTPALSFQCRTSGVDFLSTPYDLEAVDHLDPYVPAFKIGSGDITYLELLEKVAEKGKPVILATGASTVEEINKAMGCLRRNVSPEHWFTFNGAILQCNTNYGGNSETEPPYEYLNLRFLRRLDDRHCVIGLSDHTLSHLSVLGAVALGAKIIEKHFTDGLSDSPDSTFALQFRWWQDMVGMTRKLERALGDGIKRVEENEWETVIVQRRCLRAAADLSAGTALERKYLAVLRPCPTGAIGADELASVLGRTLKRDIESGQQLAWEDLCES